MKMPLSALMMSTWGSGGGEQKWGERKVMVGCSGSEQQACAGKRGRRTQLRLHLVKGRGGLARAGAEAPGYRRRVLHSALTPRTQQLATEVMVMAL
jgi:hypothetical protein